MSRKSYDKLLSQKNVNDKEIMNLKSKVKMLQLKLKDVVAMKGVDDYIINDNNKRKRKQKRYGNDYDDEYDDDINITYPMHNNNTNNRRSNNNNNSSSRSSSNYNSNNNRQISLKRSNSVPLTTATKNKHNAERRKAFSSSSQNELTTATISSDNNSINDVNKLKKQQQQQIMWANPFRNKTNQTQSTRSFLSSKNIANKKVNGNAKKGKYIKKGFNGLGGTHNVFMPKKKSLITNHMMKKKKKLKNSGINPFKQ